MSVGGVCPFPERTRSRKVEKVLYLSEENAVELHTTSVVSLSTREDGREENRDPVKNISLCHCMIFVLLVAIC